VTQVAAMVIFKPHVSKEEAQGFLDMLKAGGMVAWVSTENVEVQSGFRLNFEVPLEEVTP
jgi:hypothetical protein